MKDIGNVWCPWEVGHVKTRHAGSIPVTSVKVLHFRRQFVRRMLCGQAKSLGRLIEAYIGIVGTGAQPGRRYLVYVENRVQLPLRTKIGCLKQLFRVWLR